MTSAARSSGLRPYSAHIFASLPILAYSLVSPPGVLIGFHGGTESLFVVDAHDDPHREPGGVFCFAFSRSPPEETHGLFLTNLRAACDGHAVYSTRANPKQDVVQAYSAAEERLAFQTQMQEMTLGAWRQMSDTGALIRYDWFLKVEPDTFLVPSRLRSGVLRQNSSKSVVFGQRATSDGFFVLMSREKLLDLKRGYEKHPECVDKASFELVSGANMDGHRPGQHNKASCPFVKGQASMLDERGDLLVAAWPNCHELHRVTKNHVKQKKRKQTSILEVTKKTRLCDRFTNGLLTCAEYGSSKDCSREAVAKKQCGGGYGDHDDDICVSPDFVALHPVKLRKDFESLARTFL